MKKIAIIGAGIFGSTTALELEKTGKFDISLFERHSRVLDEATSKNLLRAHFGYHYPRSGDTAQECIKSDMSFKKDFAGCISGNFPSYYAVAKEGSKTTPENFLKFCDENKMPYEISWPSEEWLDRSKISLCIKTNEPVYDPDKLREIVTNRLNSTSIKLLLNNRIVGGGVQGGKKRLMIKSSKGLNEGEFDIVVGAVYSHLNEFSKWFNFPTKDVRYQLFEILEINLPTAERLGIIVVDGNYSAFLPNGFKNNFRLANAGESVIKKIVSDYLDIDKLEEENKISVKDDILNRAKYFYPIMERAEIVKSIYLTQLVKAHVENTDERPSEIIFYGNGIYSIFAGKVVTCLETAKEIAEMIEKEVENL